MNTNPTSPTHPTSPVTPVLLLPRSLLWLFGLAALFSVLILLRELLLLVLLGGLLAAALHPAVRRLEDRGIPRKPAILLCYLVIVLAIAGVGFLLMDIIVDQGQALLNALPSLVDRAVELINRIPLIGGPDGRLVSALSNNSREIASQAIDVAQRAFNYLMVLFQSFFGLITVLVFAFFLLSDTDYFRKTALRMTPATSRERVACLLGEISGKAGAYARGQLLVMTATGLITGLGLYLLGVPYALTLGVITFLLDIIPILGPFLAAGFGIIVALAENPLLALWTALVYLAAQQIENNLLSPTILGKSVGLNAFWILFSILAGAKLLGVIGVILAVPMTVAIGLIIETFYIKGYLDRQPVQIKS